MSTERRGGGVSIWDKAEPVNWNQSKCWLLQLHHEHHETKHCIWFSHATMSVIDIQAGILAGESMSGNLSPPMIAAVTEVPPPELPTSPLPPVEQPHQEQKGEAFSVKSDSGSIRKVSGTTDDERPPSAASHADDEAKDAAPQDEIDQPPPALPVPATGPSKVPSFAGTSKHLELLDRSDELGCRVLSRYTLYETRTRYYITASSGDRHKILKIDRTMASPSSAASSGASSGRKAAEDLNVAEDAATYDQRQLETLLRMVDDGNKSMGGLEKVLDFQ